MYANTRFLLALVAPAMISCHAHLPQAKLPECAPNRLEVVSADSGSGFNYPYLLRLPDCSARITPYIVVEPNNTGNVSDNLTIHLDAARALAQESSVGSFISEYLNAPLLVPVFPRPENDWHIYTHALDRDTMLVPQGPMARIDQQLIAMIDDAREKLLAMGISVSERSLLTGFSASGTFVNRFTALHPEKVRAVAAGGLNGLAILPRSNIGEYVLEYPLGIHDIQDLIDHTFLRDKWLTVPQFLYMGENDTNDAVEYDDGYSDAERRVVFQSLGKRMQPDRWSAVQKIYVDEGANVVFKTYKGVGHGTNLAIRTEMAVFFLSAISE